MNKVKLEIEAFEVQQRLGNELAKGDILEADEDLCYILLPKEFSNRNVVCILTEEFNR